MHHRIDDDTLASLTYYRLEDWHNLPYLPAARSTDGRASAASFSNPRSSGHCPIGCQNSPELLSRFAPIDLETCRSRRPFALSWISMNIEQDFLLFEYCVTNMNNHLYKIWPLLEGLIFNYVKRSKANWAVIFTFLNGLFRFGSL